MMIVRVFVFCLFVFPVICDDTYLQWTSKGPHIFTSKTEPRHYIAKARYTNSINSTGWAFLEVKTKGDGSDNKQAYSAGYIEGYLTKELIYPYWRNVVNTSCDGKEDLCNRVRKFLSNNWKFLKFMTKTDKETDPFWNQISLLMVQLEGLVDGYNNATDKSQRLSFMEFMWMNSITELGALFNALGSSEEKRQHPEWFELLGRCSAIVKLLPGQTDLLVSHVTWSSYQSMLRILKKYSFEYRDKNNKLIPGHTMSMSSYPATLFSIDDFYVISSGLTVTETTIGNNNPKIWKYVSALGEVLVWMRAMAANRLADSGLSWCKYFRDYNSGTYNNEWIIIDYNKFVKGANIIKDNLLWVLEQIPGLIQMGDQTDILRSRSYFASYNIPYYKSVFDMGGFADQEKKHGDIFSHDSCPRAKIFQRDHNNVKDIPSLIKLMRYNNFTKDPLSRCKCKPPFSGELAISARCDLNPKNGTYPLPMLGHRSHGATDMKVTSLSMSQSFDFVAIGGPTYDPLPPFIWSKSDFNNDTQHYSHPDVWAFKPIRTMWNYTSTNKYV